MPLPAQVAASVQLRVAIAGEGDLESELRARAQSAGVGEQVQFLGVVPHHEVPALLAAADVAVAPSVHDAAGNVDGLPNTVMEMMASPRRSWPLAQAVSAPSPPMG